MPEQSDSCTEEWPQGLHVLHDFVSEEMEKTLLACVNWEQEDKHLVEGEDMVFCNGRSRSILYQT